MSKQPIITPDLIDYLDNLYKDQVPSLSYSDREVWFKAGSVEVIRHLKHLKKLQEDNMLSTIKLKDK